LDNSTIVNSTIIKDCLSLLSRVSNQVQSKMMKSFSALD